MYSHQSWLLSTLVSISMATAKKHLHFIDQHLVENLEKSSVSRICRVIQSIPSQTVKQTKSCTSPCLSAPMFLSATMSQVLWAQSMNKKTEVKYLSKPQAKRKLTNSIAYYQYERLLNFLSITVLGDRILGCLETSMGLNGWSILNNFILLYILCQFCHKGHFISCLMIWSVHYSSIPM